MSDAARLTGGAPPPSIPGYRIEAALGRGATGVVYRAVQLSIGRVVALKVLHPGSIRDTRVVRRLQREARTAARLTHPNIISAIDMGRTADTWWFAMELVEGDSLAERLQHGGRLSERKALAIFIPLCDALQHASEKGVVHRDIKPANILLERGDVPRLVDLGLARVENDPLLTRTGATLGTPHYISPEQARDPSRADVRSDIWSLGATMFHAVCGRPPFEGTSAAELLSNVLYGGIPDPRSVRPDLSKGLALVLRKCLSRDPDLRYSTAAELREDLERVRARKPVSVKKSALEPVDRGARRAAPPWLAAVAVALVLALLAWWQPWRARDGEPEQPANAAASWPRFDALLDDLAAGRISLAEAWVEREELCADPAPGYRAACDELWKDIYARLEIAYDRVTTPLGARVGALLAERRFADVDQLLASGLAAELREATGFEPRTLPRRFELGWANLVEQQGELLRHGRESALENLVKTLEGYFENNLRRTVESLRAEGRLAEALALVDRRPPALYEEAGVDPRGLDAQTLAERLRPLDRRLQDLAVELRYQQKAVDQELSRWLEETVRTYEERLEARAILEASERMASDFRQRLADERLSLERLREESAAGAVSWSALERFERLREALVARERELLEADAEARFRALEEEAAALLEERRYERDAELWREHASEPVLGPLAGLVELRVAEAEELARFLARAAAGVAALDGRDFKLQVRGIEWSGRVDAERDPLENGFRLVFDPRSSKVFRLRGGAGGDVLDTRAIELLARAGAEAAGAEGSALELALFRYHEGDLRGARQALDEGELPAEDPLVRDLELRLVEGIDRRASLRERERALARGKYERLTARHVEGDRGKAIAEIDELLRTGAEFLSGVEQERLRELKRTLGGAGPSTPEEFREGFRIEDVDFLGVDQVALGYAFDEPVAGTWDRGDWSCDGTGWIRGAPVSSDAELVRAAAPKLLLVDPFVVGPRLRVRALIEQPPDSPQNMLVLSAFGFHAVFTRTPGQKLARCLVDTDEMARVIDRARAGEGVDCPPFEPGGRYEIVLGVTPDRGKPYLWIDGKELDLPLRTQAGNKRSQSVTIRSLEPVRLLEAEVRGGRR